MENIFKKIFFNFFIYTMTKIHAQYQASPMLLTDLILVNKKNKNITFYALKIYVLSHFSSNALTDFFFGFSIVFLIKVGIR